MKKNIVIIVLLVLLLGTSGYLIYDKFFTEDSLVENGVTNKNEDNNINETIDDKNDNEDISNNKPAILGIDNFKNHDGSYGFVEMLTYKNEYFSSYTHYVKLDLLGNLIYEVTDNGKNLQNAIILENVVDILLCGSSPMSEDAFYVLDSNGDVYKYILYLDKYDIPKNKKITSSITRIMVINTFPLQNAGGSVSYVGVTTEEKIIKLSGFAV